ncbi:hypothetical protein FQA47_022418 [Oryzias melastigma]|uniref:Uncharacterized protein n=1 Tax=Oryzias melastigma TaxID=30732 RepID=A0A834FQM2_ORYME|nr:hypothetical protein FQA47_022418 [Oryzias melastigma]
MASCLVPEFPAVLVALEHLEELNRQLREDGEASILLSDIAAAVSQLEADRRAAHEHLEVETIENGKLRHQVSGVHERLRREVTAHAAAARAAHAEEMETLRKDLSTASELHQQAAAKLLEVLIHSKELQAEQEARRSDLEEVVATFNDLLVQKQSRQVKLKQSSQLMEELRSSITAAEQELQTLQESMSLEREAFPKLKARLPRQVEEIQEETDQQVEAVNTRNQELDRVNKQKEEAQRNLEELDAHVAQLESNVARLKSSRQQCEQQLEDETRIHQELMEQNLKKELDDLKEVFSRTIYRLQDRMAAVEAKIVVCRAAMVLHRESLPQMEEIYKRRQAEENDGKAELLRVSQRLKRLKLQLDQSTAAIVQRHHEIRLMDRQVKELQETEAVNGRLLKKNKEKLLSSVHAERKNVSGLEDEVKQLRRQLEEETRRQEEHVEKMKADVSDNVRRYEELLQEKAALHQRQPQSADPQILKSLSRPTGGGVQTRGECPPPEHSGENHWRLRASARTSERSRGRRWRRKTRSQLLPKEDTKAELEEARARHMELLEEQASALRTVEVSVYDSSVKLEQVSAENRRLRLCIQQMTEDVRGAVENKDRYEWETQKFRRNQKALRKRLQEAFEEDRLLVQDHQSGDGVLLTSMKSLVEQLKNRKQQLLHFSTLLHRQMLDFSKRLGEKTDC